MILTKGHIHTLDVAHAGATAIAIRGDTIHAVGTDDQIAGLARPGEERVDLDGRTVIPGLVDSHIHLNLYARS